MATRYSIDISSPVTPLTRSEQEGEGLLVSPPLSPCAEKSGRDENSWDSSRRKKGLNRFLILLALLSSLLGAAGWIMYWRALPGLRLVGEINGLVPEFPIRPVVFEDDPLTTSDHKTAESANATYEYWVSFMPMGNGFMNVQHDDKYILAPPMVQNGNEFYSIAVFHQLHCLHSLMKMYNKLAGDLYLAKRGVRQDRAEEAHHHPDPQRHADHCFRYLRQSIVCCADTALEGQNPRAKIPDTDGTGATHLCKDFEMVKAWASEMRVDDTHSI